MFILNQFTEEEKTYILNESLTYYDILGLEDFIPNENFARLLNSKGEIIVNDSIYRITPWGTLCGKVEHRELIDRVSSLMFRFLDQNRYYTSFKALIIMSLQDMLT